MRKKQAKLKAVDFFCGAGGMTNGFSKAGIKVLAGVDIDKDCKDTYEKNNIGSKFIEADIKKMQVEGLAELAGIKRNDDALVFIGCSPCQYWSIINTDKTKSKKSRNLLKDFQKFVEYYNPGFIVIENVPGLYSKKKETPLTHFLRFLEEKKYVTDKGVLNASKHGVPQSRKRFLLVASRVSPKISLPQPTKKVAIVKDFIFNEKKFYPIGAGHKDGTDFIHTTAGLSATNLKRLRITPKNGGTRMAWKDNPELQIKAYANKDDIFRDVYGRMRWGTPGPTITTKFFSISNGRFAHPEQDRPISLREGATLQTFDTKYKFFGNSMASIARQIGNAVPPELSKRIAKAIIKHSH